MNPTAHHWKPVLCGIAVLLGLAAATSAAAASTLTMITAVDTDHHGTLDRAELATGHAKMLLKRPK